LAIQSGFDCNGPFPNSFFHVSQNWDDSVIDILFNTALNKIAGGQWKFQNTICLHFLH